MTTAAEQLAILRQMLADTDDQPDLRSQAAIDEDMRLEQAAEDRAAMRRNPSDSDSEWAARRAAG